MICTQRVNGTEYMLVVVINNASSVRHWPLCCWIVRFCFSVIWSWNCWRNFQLQMTKAIYFYLNNSIYGKYIHHHNILFRLKHAWNRLYRALAAQWSTLCWTLFSCQVGQFNLCAYWLHWCEMLITVVNIRVFSLYYIENYKTFYLVKTCIIISLCMKSLVNKAMLKRSLGGIFDLGNSYLNKIYTPKWKIRQIIGMPFYFI